MEEMIAYKAVGEDTRDCSNWTLFDGFYSNKNHPAYKEGLEFKEKHKEYFPVYKKGSVGILCFESEEEAYGFIIMYGDYTTRFKIIKVRGINKLETPKFVNVGCGGDYLTKINMDTTEICRPPIGTIAFEAVEVLE